MPYKDPVVRHAYKMAWKRKKRIAAGKPARTDLTPIETFMRYVSKQDSCWIWNGPVRDPRRRNGHYGVFSLGGKRHSAHRWLYEHTVGPVPRDLFCCHKCDNPRCVNPEHIFIGSQADNIADCTSKGRHHSNRHSEKTHCPRGHEYSKENTMIQVKSDGVVGRKCKMCNRLRMRKIQENRRLAALL